MSFYLSGVSYASEMANTRRAVTISAITNSGRMIQARKVPCNTGRRELGLDAAPEIRQLRLHHHYGFLTKLTYSASKTNAQRYKCHYLTSTAGSVVPIITATDDRQLIIICFQQIL